MPANFIAPYLLKTVLLNSCLGVIFACIILLHTAAAQSPVTFYTIQNNSSLAAAQHTVTGWNSNNPFGGGGQFHLHYGQSTNGGGGLEREIMGFNVGNRSFSRQAGMNGSPFDRVLINRHPNLPGDTINAFYEFTPSSGNNLFLAPSYVSTLESLINSYICNRGSDNLFSNSPTTRSNIERVDLIQTTGIQVLNSVSQGFLINERGGNDNFKVAVITAINSHGAPTALGNLLQITSSRWGRIGPSIQTRVMSRRLTADAVLRPKEDIAAQTIAGVYISFADLGVSNGSLVYGLAIFPNDVTAAMDLIGLSNVPTNTNQNTDGGLDMIAGMGYFIENFVLPQGNRIDFGLTQLNRQVQLQWTPSQDLAFSKAELQRSNLGTDFSTIAEFLPGAIPSNGSYMFKDNLHGLTTHSVSYRLRLVDLRGNIYYSHVRQVHLQKALPFEWKHYPDPFTDHLQVRWRSSSAGVMELSLLSLDGIVQQQTRHPFAAGSGVLHFSIPPHLPSGIYLLRTAANGSIETRRVVKW